MNHKSQIMTTESGKTAIVLADPNMSPETEKMLGKLIDKAYEYNEEQKIPCHSCQGGGCEVCSGHGYYYNKTNEI